jgi:hypothetical protein
VEMEFMGGKSSALKWNRDSSVVVLDPMPLRRRLDPAGSG